MANAKRERSTRATGNSSSVESMVRATSDDKVFVDDFGRKCARRRMIHHLITLRGAMGLSQTHLAKLLGCTQSRISKMEASDDDEITIGDIRKYASALGLSIQLSLIPRGATTVDRVKFHAFRIKTLVNNLAGLTENDPAIANGISSFFGEAAFNLLLILQEAADKLPRSATEGDDMDDTLCETDGTETFSSLPQPALKKQGSTTRKPNDRPS